MEERTAKKTQVSINLNKQLSDGTSIYYLGAIIVCSKSLVLAIFLLIIAIHVRRTLIKRLKRFVPGLLALHDLQFASNLYVFQARPETKAIYY